LAILNSETAPDVGLTLDRHGRAEASIALTGLLQAACERGLLGGAKPEEMAVMFNSLLMGGGILIRMLMRVAHAPTESEARERAEAAAGNIWRLFGQGQKSNAETP
jgi:hypothetical protein